MDDTMALKDWLSPLRLPVWLERVGSEIYD